MRVREIRAERFKRFTDLTITGLPASARLVVLLGINGRGKSSVFEGLNQWKRQHNVEYFHPKFQDKAAGSPLVSITFHEEGTQDRRKAVYLRSAYRNEAHFQTTSISAPSTVEDEEANRLELLVHDDRRVQQNYNRIVANTTNDIFREEGADDPTTKRKLRDTHIGPLRESMRRVFGDLVLHGVGDPHNRGTFLFEKGKAKGFPHINLSAGEKDAFDLLLDVFLRKDVLTDAVYCIDEPDLHMHSRLQGKLLQELVDLIPPKSQLWIATHSIGMMRKAIDLETANPGYVVFLDFSERDFDQPVVVKPVKMNRPYWKKLLAVAVDDLASLVAPRRIVACEGRPAGTEGRTSRREHDAKCLRRVFEEEFIDTEFVSLGNSDDVSTDSFKLLASLEQLLADVQIVRVIDRDGRNPEEIEDLNKRGIRVLRRRHLESYLLDDEVLQELCRQQGKPDKFAEVKRAKEEALSAAKQRGKTDDDAKAAAGQFFNSAIRVLEIQNPGSNWEAFFATHMAGALRQRSRAYEELKEDIFGKAI